MAVIQAPGKGNPAEEAKVLKKAVADVTTLFRTIKTANTGAAVGAGLEGYSDNTAKKTEPVMPPSSNK